MRLPTAALVIISVVITATLLIAAPSRTTPIPQSNVSRPVEPCSASTLQQQFRAPSGQDEALRELASQEAKWKARQPASYRLCVATFNALLITLTETDVVRGQIRVARQAFNERALKERLAADDWSPSEGTTVEMLFDGLRRGLMETTAPKKPGEERFLTTATYNQTFGFPEETHTEPAPGTLIFDTGVMTLIRLTPSPAVPLPRPSARSMRH